MKSETISNGNHSTDVRNCQVEDKEQPFVSLRFETDDIEVRQSYDSWAAVEMLTQLALSGLPSVIIGEPGSGRSVAVAMAGAGDSCGGAVRVLAGIRSDEELERDILPPLSWAREWKTEHQWEGLLKHQTQNCGYCSRNCRLIDDPHDVWSRELMDWFLTTLWEAKGNCPLRLELAVQWLIKEGKPIIIDAYNSITIEALTVSLLRARIPVILVASQQNAGRLTRHPEITMPVLPFPPMDDAVLTAIAKARGCDDTRIIQMARGNPRRLVTALALLSVGKPPELVEGGVASTEEPLRLEAPKRTLEERVEEYCQLNKGTAITPTGFKEWLYSEYDMEVSPEKVGNVLTSLGYKGKHTMKGTEYSL